MIHVLGLSRTENRYLPEEEKLFTMDMDANSNLRALETIRILVSGQSNEILYYSPALVCLPEQDKGTLGTLVHTQN